MPPQKSAKKKTENKSKRVFSDFLIEPRTERKGKKET